MRFLALDGWRGLCALSVALLHFSFSGHTFELRWVRNAGVLVDFFFVLSGFVIAHAYRDKIRDGVSFIGFTIRRVGRLWPLHMAMLVCFIALEVAKWGALHFAGLSAGEGAFEGRSLPWAIPTNILMIHAMGLHGAETWNGPSWSISTEFWANILFGVLCIGMRNRGWVRLSLAFVGLSLAVFSLMPGDSGTAYRFVFFRCTAGFFAGIIAYDCYLRTRSWNRSALGSAEIPAVLLLLAYCIYYREFDLGMLKAAVFALVIAIFAHEQGLVSKLVKTPAVVFLGKVSFSIYLCHGLVLAILNGLIRALQQVLDTKLLQFTVLDGKRYEMLNFGPPVMMDAVALLYLGLVLGVSALTWRFIEEPGRRYFNKLALTTESTLRGGGELAVTHKTSCQNAE